MIKPSEFEWKSNIDEHIDYELILKDYIFGWAKPKSWSKSTFDLDPIASNTVYQINSLCPIDGTVTWNLEYKVSNEDFSQVNTNIIPGSAEMM